MGQQSESVYRAVCVVAESSLLRSVDDLRRAAGEVRVQFLFVHPLSVSGRIAPEFALREVGINPAQAQVEYTYSHSNSLRLLSEHSRERERLAFVWDGALGDSRAQGKDDYLLLRADVCELRLGEQVTEGPRWQCRGSCSRRSWSGFGDSVYRRRWCSVSDYRDRAKR